MYTLSHSYADKLYANALELLMRRGVKIAPRNLPTIELTPVTLSLTSPRCNIVASPSRGVNLGFMGAELLWMLMGRMDVEMLSFYNGQMSKFSDDGVWLRGAYGPKLMPQLKYCYDLLRKDPDSRQAVINIWQESPTPSKDIPCTVMLHFLKRNDRLHLQVYMRSNDAWLGLPYDLHNFTSIQILMARLLGCYIGEYHHIVGSFHIYEEHFEKALGYTLDVKNLDPEATQDPITVNTWQDLQDQLVLAESLDLAIRSAAKLAPEHLDPLEAQIKRHPDPFFGQKLGWMVAKAKRKVSRV